MTGAVRRTPEQERTAEPSARREPAPSEARRLPSLDATRGWAITIMLVALHPFPRAHLPAQLSHPEWFGLHFVDLFFPLFLFVMGVSMSLSRRSREPRQVLRRVALLLLLGIALSSLKHERLAITGVLQHIAVAYLLAWIVLRAPRRAQFLITVGILAAVWAGFVVWADANSDPWGPQGTLAHAVDGRLIGGFATEGVLPTVTSTVNVLGGALIGRRLKERPDPQTLWRWVGAHGLWLITAALMVSVSIPITKRVWSPSFAVLTLGASCLWLAFFIWFVDVRGHRRWVAPLRDLGANPIAVYAVFMALLALLDDFRPLMPALAPLGSLTAGALVYSAVWLFFGWLFAHALYRRRVFVKI